MFPILIRTLTENVIPSFLQAFLCLPGAFLGGLMHKNRCDLRMCETFLSNSTAVPHYKKKYENEHSIHLSAKVDTRFCKGAIFRIGTSYINLCDNLLLHPSEPSALHAPTPKQRLLNYCIQFQCPHLNHPG